MCALFEAVVDLLKHGLAASLEHGQHDTLEGVLVRRLYGPLHGFGRCPTNGIRRVLLTGSGFGWEGQGKGKGRQRKRRRRSDEDGHLPWIWPPCWHCPSARPPRRSSSQPPNYSADLSPAPDSLRWLEREGRNWQRQISRSSISLMRAEDPSPRGKERTRTSPHVRRLGEMLSNTPRLSSTLLDLIHFLSDVKY